jgi:hypothetical protein
MDGGEGVAEVENKLNNLQSEGYEMASVIGGHRAHNRIVVMRSMPPMPPTAADVLSEMNRRSGADAVSDSDIDNFGPTIGGLQ